MEMLFIISPLRTSCTFRNYCTLFIIFFQTNNKEHERLRQLTKALLPQEGGRIIRSVVVLLDKRNRPSQWSSLRSLPLDCGGGGGAPRGGGPHSVAPPPP